MVITLYSLGKCKRMWRNVLPRYYHFISKHLRNMLMLAVSVCLSFLVGVNDVTFSQHCRAGVLLKLMDECAGIVAAKHCQTNVVTACLNATNFYRMIPVGTQSSVVYISLKSVTHVYYLMLCFAIAFSFIVFGWEQQWCQVLFCTVHTILELASEVTNIFLCSNCCIINCS